MTILGSSSAFPTSKRYPTAHVLNARERFFLIDCGEGTQVQLRNNKIKFGKLNHIFISHLHGDHFFGLFGLLSTFSLLGRKSPLHIYSPEGLEKIVRNLFDAVGDQLPYELCFHVIDGKESSVIFEDKHITVESIPLKHRITTYGFLFREKPMELNIIKEMIDVYELSIKDILSIKEGNDFVTSAGKIVPNSRLTQATHKSRSFAFCSDTAYSEKFLKQIKNVDLLYHEATFLEDAADLAKQSFHSTARQAARVAYLAKVDKLVIGHFSPRYKRVQAFLKEATAVFENTVLAEDNLVIKL